MVLRCSQIFTCFFLKPSKFDFRVSNFSLILITNHLCKYMFYLLHERIKCLWFVKSIILHTLQTFFYTVPVYFSHGPRTWLILCANSLNTRQYKNCPCMWMHIHKPYIYCKRCFFFILSNVYLRLTVCVLDSFMRPLPCLLLNSLNKVTFIHILLCQDYTWRVYVASMCYSDCVR